VARFSRAFLYILIAGGITVVGLLGGVRAQSIVVNPSTIILGSLVTYSVQAPSSWQITSYNWQYRYDDGTCVSGWSPVSPTPTTATQYVQEAYPGTFDVQCTITYILNGNYSQPFTATPSTSLTITPPNGVRIVSGLNTSVAIGGSIVVVFQMQTNGVDVGPYTGGGYAQEYITNKVLFGSSVDSDDAWSPAYGQPSTRFYASSPGRIYDTKSVSNSSLFQSWPYESIFFTRTQQLQTTFTDPCGNLHVYSLGQVNLANQKINDETWQILQQ
jgi:hypothetical protein